MLFHFFPTNQPTSPNNYQSCVLARLAQVKLPTDSTRRPCPCTRVGAGDGEHTEHRTVGLKGAFTGHLAYFPRGNSLQEQFFSVNMAEKIQARRRKQGFLSPIDRWVSRSLPCGARLRGRPHLRSGTEQLLAAHGTSLNAGPRAVEQMFSLGSSCGVSLRFLGSGRKGRAFPPRCVMQKRLSLNAVVIS